MKSVYINYPSQGNSTNYYVILGPRDKAAPPISQQINKNPSQASEVSSDTIIRFYFLSSSSTGELSALSQSEGEAIFGVQKASLNMFWEHSPYSTIIASDWLRAELSCG